MGTKGKPHEDDHSHANPCNETNAAADTATEEEQTKGKGRRREDGTSNESTGADALESINVLAADVLRVVTPVTDKTDRTIDCSYLAGIVGVVGGEHRGLDFRKASLHFIQGANDRLSSPTNTSSNTVLRRRNPASAAAAHERIRRGARQRTFPVKVITRPIPETTIRMMATT